MAFSLSHYRKEYKQEVQDKLDQEEREKKEARRKFQAWMLPMADRVRNLLLDKGKPVYARCGWFRTNPNEMGGYRFVIDKDIVIEILPDKEHEFLVSACKAPGHSWPRLAPQGDAGEFEADGSITQVVGTEVSKHYLYLDPCSSDEGDELDEEFLRDVAKLCEE